MSGSKKKLNRKIRTKASQVLFPLLNNLNVQAALIGNPGLGLLYPGYHALKELVVVVDHRDPKLRFPELAAMILAKDSVHFSSPSVKDATIAFQAKEVPEIETRSCTIQFLSVKAMEGFTVDLARRIVVNTFPVMPGPWIFLALLEQWATGAPKERAAEKKITKDITKAVEVICGQAGRPDWTEFNLALVSFPRAKEQLVMLAAVSRTTNLELIRKNTSISSSSPKPRVDIPQRLTPSAAPSEIPKIQFPSFLSFGSPPALQSSLRAPPGVGRVTDRKPEAITSQTSAPQLPPNTLSTSMLVSSVPETQSIPIPSPLSVHSTSPPDRIPNTIKARHPAIQSLSSTRITSTAVPPAVEPVPRTVPLEFHNITQAYALLVQLNAWASCKETHRSRIALLNAWLAFFKVRNWSEFNVALKWFPDANQQLAKLQVAFPHLPREQFESLREKTTIASQELRAGPDSVESNQVSVTTERRSVPVSISAAPLYPLIPVPPPSSKLIPSVAPVPSSIQLPPKPGTGPHNYNSILMTIARDVVNTLRESGFRCAFLGSLGYQLYGNRRLPEDLEVLVFPPPGSLVDQEFIKRKMVNRNNQFYMEAVVDRTATYRVLFRAIPQHAVLPPNFTGRFCKVDVLLPGVMSLPYLNEGEVNEVEGLPVVPVLVLLLQKLQEWEVHFRCVTEPDKFKKHMVDMGDIKELLGRVVEMPVRLFRPWSERESLGQDFVNASKVRVKRFCAKFPETVPHWEGLGFELV
ncbi:hypothetical protein FA15DRAFT_670386 [Coprinopsis marcescibilis]|uniref:Uncharacterized protein n=1 Tax=Coprinopsis marcescibilis TaxID=230819 RepID=A0A5C3KSY9_COPMA|nr:hypothetical protein FA15DRAFT_670386 [Coprinopsis marcescibilis]